jgi:RNA polymerase sigma factor (sigma-70 family)
MTTPDRPVIAHIRRWLVQTDPGTDADLLKRFADGRDENAFTLLMDRHGPMVLGVARRVTGDFQIAEDVFQATFLALARQARGIRRPAAVAAWLHRTAHRIALTAVRARGRRDRAESAAPVRPGGDPLAELSGRELVIVLDKELRRLPARLRQPLVLCCLEGRSADEAARLLGWSAGSLRGRLARGRSLLRARLSRRGLTFAIGAGTSLLLARPEVLPGALRSHTLAAVFDRGRPSAGAAALAGVGPRMATARIHGFIVTVFGIAGLAAIAAVSSPPAGPKAPPREDPPPAETRADSPLPPGATARLGWDPLRAGNARAALTPDGKRVIALTAGAVIHVFDAATGKLIERRPLGDRRDVFPETWFYSLSADGSTAAAVENSPSGRFTVWDVATGRQLLRLGHTQAHALSADGRMLAADAQDDRNRWSFRVYDLTTGKGRDLGAGGAASYLWLTPDGKRLLASMRGDGDVESLVCYDVAEGRRIWTARPSGTASTFTPDGRLVFLAKPDTKQSIRVLDMETGKPVESFKLPTFPTAGPPAAAGDRLLLLPLNSGEVAVWDYRAGKELHRLRATKREFLSVRAFPSPDGKTAITDADGLRRWDLATGDLIFGPTGEPAHYGYVNALTFLPDGRLVTAGAGSELRTWDVTTGRPAGEVARATGSGLSVTRAGLRMVKVEWARRLTVVDPAGKQVGQVKLPDDGAPMTSENYGRSVLLADGRTALTYQPSRKGKALIVVSDYVAGKTLSQVEIELPGDFDYFQGFSPCGRWVAVGGKVFTVATGKPVWTPPAGKGWIVLPQSPVRFSPDGRLMCCRVSVESSPDPDDFERGEHDVWEVASGTRVARFTAKHLQRVVFRPDNRTLAYVTGYGVHLLDLATGKLMAEYEDPGINCANYLSGEAPTLAFSPDGRSVATGHLDGSVLVWKVPRPAGTALSPAERDATWADLASSDAMKARSAIDRLARDPDAALALLAERFKAPSLPAEADVPALIRDLDSPTFAAREKAARQLREAGPKVQPALREALRTATAEAKERIERLLTALDPNPQLPLTGETLRGARAIEVLERVGTPTAKGILRAWADQTADLYLAADAALALERLQLRELKVDIPRK